MSNGLKYALAFSLGAAVGAAVSWKLLKTKYEQITRDEIESVKEVYSKRDDLVTEYEEPENLEESAKELAAMAKDKPDLKEYAAKLKEEGYTETVKEVADVRKPYVISPEEFGELEDYETDYLTYYYDHILADDMDDIIDDIEGVVGQESLDRIGEYEPDLIHVRNDKLRIDYEIAVVTEAYSDDDDEITYPPKDE